MDNLKCMDNRLEYELKIAKHFIGLKDESGDVAMSDVAMQSYQRVENGADAELTLAIAKLFDANQKANEAKHWYELALTREVAEAKVKEAAIVAQEQAKQQEEAAQEAAKKARDIRIAIARICAAEAVTPSEKAHAVSLFKAETPNNNKLMMSTESDEANIAVALGVLNFDGDTVEKDLEKGFKYFIKAASLGHPYGFWMMAKLFDEGLKVDGVEIVPTNEFMRIAFHDLAKEKNYSVN
ncbi:MAG: hypothetical protein ATN35_08825 [Epulopiscium sp. Nele67-Bin004]|nr:MAG: hypothetical protein ATN35_08825 [Epulopiscium sp. Nele67-Bin004]